MSKLSSALLGVVSALALTIGCASAQTDTQMQQFQIAPGVLQQATPPAPRYIVRATTLYANDETGRDWPGSDEIYAVFVLRTPDRVGGEEFFARTTVFGDFDTGETKRFREGENCLTSAMPAQAQLGQSPVRFWDCHAAGDRINLTFKVQLFEEDSVGDNDLIGERTVRWTPQELDSANLAAGQTSSESIRIGGYTLTWEVERVS
jgi:hypothetical protein